MKGNVKFFNTGKGFGFIQGEDDKEYFVHISAVAEDITLRDNDAVTFDIEQGDRGPKAANVQLDNGSDAADDSDDDSDEDFDDDKDE